MKTKSIIYVIMYLMIFTFANVVIACPDPPEPECTDDDDCYGCEVCNASEECVDDDDECFGCEECYYGICYDDDYKCSSGEVCCDGYCEECCYWQDCGDIYNCCECEDGECVDDDQWCDTCYYCDDCDCECAYVTSITGLASGPFSEGDYDYFYVNISHELPSGCTIEWDDDDASVDIISQNSSYVYAKATFDTPGTGLHIGAETSCQSSFIYSSSFDVVSSCSCTAGKKYAGARRTGLSSVIGVEAKIKTRWGKLCCEDDEEDIHTHTCAYTNASYSGDAWAQTGFVTYRLQGSTTIHKKVYAEAQKESAPRWVDYCDPCDEPTEGSTHKYRCEKNASNDKVWDFYYDDNKWASSIEEDWWHNKKCSQIYYGGEIQCKENDMPGTSANKCEFTDCKYHRDGYSWGGTSFVSGNKLCDDYNEWGVELVNSMHINIWDKIPGQGQ